MLERSFRRALGKEEAAQGDRSPPPPPSIWGPRQVSYATQPLASVCVRDFLFLFLFLFFNCFFVVNLHQDILPLIFRVQGREGKERETSS